MTTDCRRQFLRHTLATLAYRAGRVFRNTAAAVPGHAAGSTSRTPLEILAHMNELLDWSLRRAGGGPAQVGSTPQSWNDEVERFYWGLERLDRLLASSEPLCFDVERLFQGPIADALTHVGQIAMLRRLAGDPVRGENYYEADIRLGEVGSDQRTAKCEFD